MPRINFHDMCHAGRPDRPRRGPRSRSVAGRLSIRHGGMVAVLVLSVLFAAGCADDSSLSPLEAGPGLQVTPVPVQSHTAPTDIVLELNRGYFPMEVWKEYGLVPEELMVDGMTWRVRISPDRSMESVLSGLRSDPRVQYVEENQAASFPIIRQSSMSFNEGELQPGEYIDPKLAERLLIRDAHAVSRGYGAIVAILDTGIDMDHPLLAGRIHPAAWDFVDRDPDPTERPDGIDDDGDGLVDEGLGHGSHVAGLVALLAPGAKILPLRVLNNDGQGTAYGVANAIEYALNNGARIINLSLRMTSSSAAMDRALAAAEAKGVLVVAAAGNTGEFGPLEYPACDPRVLAVASVGPTDLRSIFSAWSADIDVSAPGENLLSATWNGGYAVWSGTSMAAPIVTGTAALLMSQKLHYSGEGARKRIVGTSRAWRSWALGMGEGIVDPAAAVGQLTAPLGPASEAPRREFDRH